MIQDQQSLATTEVTAAGASNELFALTDEQILEIQPPTDSAVIPNRSAALLNEAAQRGSVQPAATSHEPQVTSNAVEAPPWLAAQMKDPWSGEEARELWNGVQQAQQEAAEYRQVFAKPGDARALKELYPGGVEQARSVAERARTLEEIDSAFYGGAGKSPEQIREGRAALAQRMLREDPAAFREMVFAGLRALEEAGQNPNGAARSGAQEPNVAATSQPASSAHAGLNPGGSAIGTVPEKLEPSSAHTAVQNAQLAEYRAFEKSANEDLERSVGTAIGRALEQALPVAQPYLAVRADAHTTRAAGHENSTQARLPALQQRLAAAIREDVEAALKSDAQLGEQIAQVLSARKFDQTTRTQVVRLINDRAQQLVPGAARRVIQDWTQTTFAAQRRTATASVVPGASGNHSHSLDVPAGSAGLSGRAATDHRRSTISAQSAAADRAEKAAGLSSQAAERNRRVDYRKLSDEQILDL
jgi:hypothetical protein